MRRWKFMLTLTVLSTLIILLANINVADAVTEQSIACGPNAMLQALTNLYPNYLKVKLFIRLKRLRFLSLRLATPLSYVRLIRLVVRAEARYES